MFFVDNEIVSFGLLCNRVEDDAFKSLVGFTAAQGRPEVSGVLLPQTSEKGAGTGNAHPIAPFTEMLRKGRDKAQLLASFLNAHIA